MIKLGENCIETCYLINFNSIYLFDDLKIINETIEKKSMAWHLL